MKLNIISTRTGAVGDLVYLRHRQGTSVRARIIPRNPRSAFQQANRRSFSRVTSGWSRLDRVQRALWHGYAAQLPGHLAGFSAYMQVNTVRLACGDAPFMTPPSPPVFGFLTLTSLNATHDFAAPHAFRLSLLATNTLAPDCYIVEATPPTSPGVSNYGRTYRVILTPDDISALSTLEQAYLERFSDPPDGSAIALRITPVTNGHKEIPNKIDTIVSQLAA